MDGGGVVHIVQIRVRPWHEAETLFLAGPFHALEHFDEVCSGRDCQQEVVAERSTSGPEMSMLTQQVTMPW